MRFVIGLVLLGFVSMIHAYSTASVATLVDEISAGNFAAAVQTTLQLQSENQYHLIQEAVDGLFQNNEKNLFEYAHRLRQDGDQIFPSEVQRILNGELVTFRNIQNNFALKLGKNIENYGDRKAYGELSDMITPSFTWKTNGTWENDFLYFYIFNIEHNQYLKLDYSADDNGDHFAYGGNSPTDDRYKWYFVPMSEDGQFKVVSVYIINKQFKQALKLGPSVDNESYVADRNVYGYNGNYFQNPDQLRWFIHEGVSYH